MATKTYVSIDGLKNFKKKTDEAYVAKEKGKELIKTTDVTKLEGIEEGAQKNNITKVTVNGTDQTIAEGTLTIDVEAVIEGDGFVKDEELTSTLAPYAKTSEIAETYATKTELTNLGTILGECTFEDLETKKEETGTGDCWVVTDKNNNIFYYNGTDFVNTHTIVDLTPYLQKTEAQSTYATTDSLTTGLAAKADTTALDNYVKTETLTTKLGEYVTSESLTSQLEGKVDDTELEGYVKSEELVEATEEEITALFAPAAVPGA